MSQLIITTDVSAIRPVFVEGTSENIKRYNQLKKIFESSKEYKIFAEPIPAGGDKVAWHTEYEGKIIPFRKLDEEELEIAKGLLKEEVNKLYKTVISIVDNEIECKRYFDLLDSCIEIPDYDDIYLIQNASGKKNFCIVRWGFINEDHKSSEHIIAKLIPIKVATVTIRAIKGNNKLATSEEIYFEYEDKKVNFTTDKLGKIYLQDIKLLTKINAYIIDNDGKNYEQSFDVKNDNEHTFFIGNQSLPKQFVSIQTLDEKDNILSNVTLKIKYDDVEFSTDSNKQGIIELGELFVDTKVNCSQISNSNKLLKTIDFEVQQGKSIYFVNIEKQKRDGKVTIKVIDENFSPIPYTEMQVKLQDGSIKHYTADENGEFIITSMPFKEDVIFRQIIDKLPQFQQIVKFSENKTIYEFKGKKIKTPLEFTKLFITILNSNDEPIANLKVKIENGVKEFNQISNNSGQAIFEDIDCLKSIKVIIENKGKKKEEIITCQGQETKHTIHFRNKIKLWWLWLLIALAVIAGVIFLPQIMDLRSTDSVVIDTVRRDTVVVEPEIGMKLKLFDQAGNPISVVASVEITIADSLIVRTSDAQGEVVFKALTDTSEYVTASISAPGFTEQLLTFKVASEKAIKLSNQSVEISEIAIPCDTRIASKGYHSTIKTFNLGKPEGRFRVLYDMFTIPDKIIVYRGSASSISEDKIIWQSGGYEKSFHTKDIDYKSIDSLITVEIKGGDTSKTQWYFKVYCPK